MLHSPFSQNSVLLLLTTLLILSSIGCTMVPEFVATATSSPTNTATRTPLPTGTFTATPTPTWMPTQTPKPTSTPTLTSTRRPSPTRTFTSTRTPIPSGPAQVAASLPDTIPCTPWENDGCIWNYKVTFTETNGVPATVERIGRRYIDTHGKIWAAESGEWFDKTIVIPGHGSNTYSSWVRTRFEDEGDLRGGIVKVSFTGRDANGNPFSGNVSAHLASPPTQ